MAEGKQYENPAQAGSDRPTRKGTSTGPQMTEPGPDGRQADLDAIDSEPTETKRSVNANVEQDESTSGMGERR